MKRTTEASERTTENDVKKSDGRDVLKELWGEIVATEFTYQKNIVILQEAPEIHIPESYAD